MSDVLKYGDRVNIQNGYNNWQGGYLDTCGNSTQGIKYNVSTATSPTRADGTGTWEIVSASGKAQGDEVISGDVIHLRNLYGGNGGYLDICGYSTAPSAIYAVGTADVMNRDSNSSQWRVTAVTSAPNDNKVREGDVVHFYSCTTYKNAPAGFLDTNGASTDGNKYGVSTNPYSDRAQVGTGSWKMTKVKAKDVLKYGDKVHLLNGYNNWQGGYLDTCNPSTQGIKYNVSTADSPARAQGTGTWVITSATGKANGQEVLSGEVIYLQNQYGGDGGHLDISGNATPSPSIYHVGTAAQPDRVNSNTSRWRVLAETSFPADGKVREGDVFHLFSETTWNNAPGGFLDTNGASTDGNKYSVVTSHYSDRANAGTGSWKFVKA